MTPYSSNYRHIGKACLERASLNLLRYLDKRGISRAKDLKSMIGSTVYYNGLEEKVYLNGNSSTNQGVYELHSASSAKGDILKLVADENKKTLTFIIWAHSQISGYTPAKPANENGNIEQKKEIASEFDMDVIRGELGYFLR